MGRQQQCVSEVIKDRQPLSTDWEACATTTGQCREPADLKPSTNWFAAPVPGTLATALAQSDHPPAIEDWDDCDWWYRCRFTCNSADCATGTLWILCFDGLATHAQVWLNGRQILRAENMFRGFEVDVSAFIAADNQLHIAFRSLSARLGERKPRPRWKTNLVEHQQLRWHRTSLLGRIPGWTPPVKPIGPWREVCLEERRQVSITTLKVTPHASGTEAGVRIQAELSLLDASTADAGDRLGAQLLLGEHRYPLDLRRDGKHLLIDQQLTVDAPLWWPHTHGYPSLVDYRLEFTCDARISTLSSGKLGFRQVEISREPRGQNQSSVTVIVNGKPVFCRGACWSVSDIHSLTGDPGELKRSLILAREAGINMLRIGGTMLYEQQAFYEACDELGIMVWQDFMFANMDYPTDDESFLANVTEEVTYQLRRLSRFACIAVYCGNSEVQQQAAMFGMPEDHWRNPLFDEHIPTLCRALHPGIPYFPSTPCEGALPFHLSEGLSHFYGIGAYQRSLSDRVIDRVKFTPECMGFSNIPADSTVEKLMTGGAFASHHPQWKAGIPRDTGTGWDFEDVRDYYLKALYGLEAAALRYSDPGRYLALSRSVTGEVMAQVFSRWRASQQCGGGLVWFYKDLVAGAGWGLLDVYNQPKAAYYYLRRAWANRAVLLNDNGLDGLEITAINESSQAIEGTLEFGLVDRGQNTIARETTPIHIAPHSRVRHDGDALLGRFYDTTYNYRFGPPKHDLAFARLIAQDGATLAEAHHFPNGLNLPRHDTAEIDIRIQPTENGFTVNLKADRFLQCVDLYIRDHEADDNYFHLLPNVDKVVQWQRTTETARSFRGTLSALNLSHPIRLQP